MFVVPFTEIPKYICIIHTKVYYSSQIANYYYFAFWRQAIREYVDQEDTLSQYTEKCVFTITSLIGYNEVNLLLLL